MFSRVVAKAQGTGLRKRSSKVRFERRWSRLGLVVCLAGINKGMLRLRGNEIAVWSTLVGNFSRKQPPLLSFTPRPLGLELDECVSSYAKLFPNPNEI